MRLLLCEWAGLLLSNLVVPYETTRITGAATVYMGFVPRGGFFQLPTQYDTNQNVLSNESCFWLLWWILYAFNKYVHIKCIQYCKTQERKCVDVIEEVFSIWLKYCKKGNHCTAKDLCSNDNPCIRIESSLDAFGEPTRQFLSAYRVLYGIFNLDPISYLLDPFCITSTLNSLDVLQLNYIVALFPLVMMVAVVLFLKSKNWCTIKCTWRRLQAQRNQGSRRWRFASSTVHAFVAFVLLSYTKFAISSAYILVPSPLFDENNTQVEPRRVLLAGQFSHNDPYYLTKYAPPSIIVIVFYVE